MMGDFSGVFARHEKVALQFSGGQDSLCILYLMRPWWSELCVYWVNPGDPFPETVLLMQQIREMVPNFIEVSGRQKEVIEQDGWPSDVLPGLWTKAGQLVFGERPFKVQGRLDCCFRSLMLPLHERMVADGITCVIRGKRAEERDKTPTRDGSVVEGIETVYPIWEWTARQVMVFLNKQGVALPESYGYAGHSLDCMSCTAWWGEGLSWFLQAKYPERFREYSRRITLIKKAIHEQLTECEV